MCKSIGWVLYRYLLYFYPDAANKKNGYTLFAPRDDAFWKISLADPSAPDPFLQVKSLYLIPMPLVLFSGSIPLFDPSISDPFIQVKSLYLILPPLILYSD